MNKKITASALLAWVIGGIYMSPLNARVTVKEAKAIYKMLCKKNKISCPKLQIITTDDINAVTYYNRIELYTGLMKIVNVDEMALVLGHELAHFNYNDIYHVPWPIKSFESRADINGAIYMSNAGYSICRGAEFFKLFSNDGGGWGGAHPSNSYRYGVLHRGCKQ